MMNTFDSSTDFINLQEPPKPKDVVNPQEIGAYSRGRDYTPRGVNKDTDIPHRLLRRSSTNYMDALKSTDRPSAGGIGRGGDEDENLEESEKYYRHRRKSSVPSMSLQDSFHERYISTNLIDSKDSDATFDSVNRSNENIEVEEKPTFNEKYVRDNEPRGPQEQRLRRNHNRKPSFQFEDYKKDMYQKSNMFPQ